MNTISSAKMVRMRVTSSRRILGFIAFVSEMFLVSFIVYWTVETEGSVTTLKEDDGWSEDGDLGEEVFGDDSI